MTRVDEDQIASIWRLQPVPKVALTAELIRARAVQFDRQVRNRIRIDILSSLGLVIGLVVAAVLKEGVILRAGLLLLAAWALMGVLLTRAIGLPDRFPSEPSASTAWYIRHLERQRDYMLSAPWGVGMALPGLILILIGYATPPGHAPWQRSVVLGGVFLFLYFFSVIYSKVLAGRWQQEISSLRSLKGGTGRPASGRGSMTIMYPRTQPNEMSGRCSRLLGVIVPLAPQYDMGGFLRRNELNAFVSQCAQVKPLEQSLSPAQQDRRDSDMQLIDEARTKILLDSMWSAANAHIQSVGCLARPVKSLVNATRDEVECRSAFHLDGRARVMRQYESWNVIGRAVSPPAFPVHVGPGTANRSEHVLFQESRHPHS